MMRQKYGLHVICQHLPINGLQYPGKKNCTKKISPEKESEQEERNEMESLTHKTLHLP